MTQLELFGEPPRIPDWMARLFCPQKPEVVETTPLLWTDYEPPLPYT